MPLTDQEIIARMSRELADKLPSMFRWVDNYHLPDNIGGVHTAYGVVSYMGMKIVRQVAGNAATGVGVTAAKPSHYLLIGILRANAPADALANFPKVLQTTAKLLGAPKDDIVVTRDDTKEKKPGIILDTFKTQKPECVTLSWPA